MLFGSWQIQKRATSGGGEVSVDKKSIYGSTNSHDTYVPVFHHDSLFMISIFVHLVMPHCHGTYDPSPKLLLLLLLLPTAAAATHFQ